MGELPAPSSATLERVVRLRRPVEPVVVLDEGRFRAQPPSGLHGGKKGPDRASRETEKDMIRYERADVSRAAGTDDYDEPGERSEGE